MTPGRYLHPRRRRPAPPWRVAGNSPTTSSASWATPSTSSRPTCPSFDDPDYRSWRDAIERQLSELGDDLLVGHSFGGSVLLKYLPRGRITSRSPPSSWYRSRSGAQVPERRPARGLRRSPALGADLPLPQPRRPGDPHLPPAPLRGAPPARDDPHHRRVAALLHQRAPGARARHPGRLRYQLEHGVTFRGFGRIAEWLAAENGGHPPPQPRQAVHVNPQLTAEEGLRLLRAVSGLARTGTSFPRKRMPPRPEAARRFRTQLTSP